MPVIGHTDHMKNGEPVMVENFVRNTIKLQKAEFYVVSSSSSA